MIGGLATVLVAALCTLDILHVGVLVDDGHHVGDGLEVAFEHLPPLFDAMEALVEVVDHIPVINLCNRVTVSKVPLDVVVQGLKGKLCDTAQIPSGFGTQAGCLVVLDEGGAEILPVADPAGRKGFQLVEHLAAHHHREVRRHDIVVVVCSSNGNGVGA